ncbi:MAG: cobyrinate a,c-diamide synthase [Zoogloeaceae bacterium]|jgi:cobyrinic acid a,c-diamide synthase|nr:cobyrinate a,c-diamide synthase [Zoogloeaceae bacterium]
MRSMHRFLVSAAHKSSGKTTLSLGLAAALRQRGLAVQTFKKGPDYIDPIWLGAASGRPCRNLDFYLQPQAAIIDSFTRHAGAADVALVEGNKGLYDGLDLTGGNSNAALAALLDLPVVLALDARGMTRGIAPLILGYQAFDRGIRIAGVILNRLGGTRHEAKLRAVIEHYTDVPVLGAILENPALSIAERHLGLMPANETATAEARIAAIAAIIAAQVDIDRLLRLTLADPLPPAPASISTPAATATPPLRLGIARDAAFGFYYADDLEALERAGAELVPFSPIADPALPAVDALFLGGGFPECFMHELEVNQRMRDSVRRAIAAGLPAYAECGGLMYLARSIVWRGEKRAMAGVIEADVLMHEKPVGRGYVRLAPTAAHPWPPAAGLYPDGIPAHEFHYSSLENIGPATRFAYEVRRGHGADGAHDGIVWRNLLASYAHLRNGGDDGWAARFVNFARAHSVATSAATSPQAKPV